MNLPLDIFNEMQFFPVLICKIQILLYIFFF